MKSASETDLRDPHLESIPPASGRAGLFGFAGSVRAAVAGVLRTVAAQRNMKIHVLSGLMVWIIGMALPLELVVRVALLFAVAIVMFAEVLNTALEAFVDLHIREYHRLAMMAKDAAAAGVLVLAATTVIVLCEILWNEWDVVVANIAAVQRSVMFGVPLVISEAIGLFFVRRGIVAVVRLAVSFALLVPLATHTTDPFFAGIAALFLLMTAWSRWSYPRFAGRGAPRSSSGPTPASPGPTRASSSET